jgi:hypothetical protein
MAFALKTYTHQEIWRVIARLSHVGESLPLVHDQLKPNRLTRRNNDILRFTANPPITV